MEGAANNRNITARRRRLGANMRPPESPDEKCVHPRKLFTLESSWKCKNYSFQKSKSSRSFYFFSVYVFIALRPWQTVVCGFRKTNSCFSVSRNRQCLFRETKYTSKQSFGSLCALTVSSDRRQSSKRPKNVFGSRFVFFFTAVCAGLSLQNASAMQHIAFWPCAVLVIGSLTWMNGEQGRGDHVLFDEHSTRAVAMTNWAPGRPRMPTRFVRLSDVCSLSRREWVE